MTVDALLVVARFLHFASCMMLFGAGAFCLALPSLQETLCRVAHPVCVLLRCCALAALFSALLWFFSVAASMTGDWRVVANTSALRTVLFETQFGRVWQWRGLIAAALVIAAFRNTPVANRITVGLSFLLLETLALTGHAAMASACSVDFIS